MKYNIYGRVSSSVAIIMMQKAAESDFAFNGSFFGRIEIGVEYSVANAPTLMWSFGIIKADKALDKIVSLRKRNAEEMIQGLSFYG